MKLELIISFGILLSYLNFLTHESSVFFEPRTRFTAFLQRRYVAEKPWGEFCWSLWRCHLCHNFHLTFLAALIFGLPLYLSVTAPMVAHIVSQCLSCLKK